MASVFYEQAAHVTAASVTEESLATGVPDDALRMLRLVTAYSRATEAHANLCAVRPGESTAYMRGRYLDTMADLAIMAICAIQGATGSASRTEGIIRRRMDYQVRRVS